LTVQTAWWKMVEEGPVVMPVMGVILPKEFSFGLGPKLSTVASVGVITFGDVQPSEGLSRWP
jgi:hypothetical protein